MRSAFVRGCLQPWFRCSHQPMTFLTAVSVTSHVHFRAGRIPAGDGLTQPLALMWTPQAISKEYKERTAGVKTLRSELSQEAGSSEQGALCSLFSLEAVWVDNCRSTAYLQRLNRNVHLFPLTDELVKSQSRLKILQDASLYHFVTHELPTEYTQPKSVSLWSIRKQNSLPNIMIFPNKDIFFWTKYSRLSLQKEL